MWGISFIYGSLVIPREPWDEFLTSKDRLIICLLLWSLDGRFSAPIFVSLVYTPTGHSAVSIGLEALSIAVNVFDIISGVESELPVVHQVWDSTRMSVSNRAVLVDSSRACIARWQRIIIARKSVCCGIALSLRARYKYGLSEVWRWVLLEGN